MKYRIYSNGKSYLLPEYKEMHSWGEHIWTTRSEETLIKLDDGDILHLTIDNDSDGSGLNCIYFHLESGECCNLFYISPTNDVSSQASTSGYLCTTELYLEAGDIIRVYKYGEELYEMASSLVNNEAVINSYGATCVLMLKLEVEEETGPLSDKTICWRKIHLESTKCKGHVVDLPNLEDRITISPLAALNELGWYFTLDSGTASVAYYLPEGNYSGVWEDHYYQQTGQGWIGSASGYYERDYDPNRETNPELWIFLTTEEDLYDVIDRAGMENYEEVLNNPQNFTEFFGPNAQPTILEYANGKWSLIQEGARQGYDY